MIEESIEDFNSNLMTPQKKHNFKISKPSPSKMRKNQRQSVNNPQALLPKPTDSPEMQKRTEQKQMQVRKISTKEADEAEKLRVSNVNLQVEEENFVELQLDNQSNNSGEKSGNESNLQIYPPNADQLRSPVRQGRQGRNAESNEKFFDHLKSHRQEQRRSFSPPFKGVRPQQAEQKCK